MLFILPIIPSRISHNFYPLFFIYSHAITYYSCYILIVSVIMRSRVCLVADKWVYLVCLRLILPEMLPNSFWEAILLLLYSLFGYISLHLASYLCFSSQQFFIMLVNILLFQHYSCQICILLFSLLCQHNRLRPTARYQYWKLPKLLLLRLVSESRQTSTSAGVVFKWIHLQCTSSQPVINCHTTGWWVLPWI